MRILLWCKRSALVFVIFSSIAVGIGYARPNLLAKSYCFVYQQPMIDEKKKIFQENLQSIMLGTASIEEADTFVYQVSKLEDKNFISVLKETAKTTSKDARYNTACFFALQGLKKLGEPNKYFLENAKLYKENFRLASWSIFVLADNSYDEVVKSELQKIRDSLPKIVTNTDEVSNTVYIALENVRFVQDNSNEFKKINDIRQKLIYLLKFHGAGCVLFKL